MEASIETGRQVGALIHRSGQVDYVIVGDANKLQLPDIGRLRAAEGRFRGLRLVHTLLRGEALTRDDLVDLVRLRLDLIAAIQLAPSGEARSVVYAHNLPSGKEGDGTPYREIGPVPVHRLDVHVGSLMADLEAEFARRTPSFAVQAKDGRAILIHVSEKSKRTSKAKAEESMKELRELARTAGTEVVDIIIQSRDHIDPRLVVGRGKLDEIVLRAIDLDAETLIFDQELTPTQANSISKVSDLKVVDRTQLIMDIFAQRAQSRDGKLHVELAQLKYSLPRLGQKDDSLSRLTGGIGGRGPGETKLEIGKRRAKERVLHLEAQLEQHGVQREQRRRKRERDGAPMVTIIGYTNAGKSTLLNTLTAAGVLAEDKLFATLEPRSRSLYLASSADGGEISVILTDTVGLIRDLPKDLFAAFRATFEEAASASLLLHIVDAYDPSFEDHIETTCILLRDLELNDIPRLLVFNKTDLLSDEHRQQLALRYPESVLLSATDPNSLSALLSKLRATFVAF